MAGLTLVLLAELEAVSSTTILPSLLLRVDVEGTVKACERLAGRAAPALATASSLR